MKIESIIIQNFRCFGPDKTTIELESGVTAFVGGNGAGKTAVLQALSRLFGVTSGQRTVRPRDFYLSPDQKELQSGTSLSVEVIFSFPELENLEGDAIDAAVPEFFLQMAASSPGAPLKARIKLKATWTDNGTPDGVVDEDIRWIRTLDDNFSWDECERVEGVERGSIQLVYLPATRDAATQVTSLLKGRLWQAAKWSDKFRKTSARSAEVIQKRFEREGPARFILERLLRRWSQVHEADTDTTPILRLFENRFGELVRNANFAFHPDEAGQERDLTELSDGQRSLFHISLTAATLEVERDAFAFTGEESLFDQEKLRRQHMTVLAIEEPENCGRHFFSRVLLLSHVKLVSCHRPKLYFQAIRRLS
jgi:putative ATP-dependent endonuclease of the OLD family